jgi:hypothetical protein
MANRATEGSEAIPPRESPPPQISIAQLEQAIRGQDPAARLLLPRILRRVIREHCRLPALGLSVPHRKSYIIQREPLLELVSAAELGIHRGEELPPCVILLERPSPEELATTPAAELLTQCWRLLFHARVHVALGEQIAAGRLSAAQLRQRMRQIGPVEFEEIRTVLAQEEILLPPGEDTTVYVEFAAVFLELRAFAPGLLPSYFPALEDHAAVAAVLAKDVDADALLRATRPPGAMEPQDRVDSAPLEPSLGDTEIDEDEAEGVAPLPSEAPYRKLMAWAEKAALAGNIVRAAMLKARAERWAPRKLAAKVRTAIRGDVNRLAHRLLSALEIRDGDPESWEEPLVALVNQTRRGIWTVEARLLYDLQKVCIDVEREIYTVDVIRWAISLGKWPVKRLLPNQRDVLMSKHLQSAARRLTAVRLSNDHRRQLSELIRASRVRAEERIRERFRPLIGATLDEVGLRPQNIPERVARKKLVEELLDLVAERGFITMGLLRDALSRNNLKLPDYSRPSDFFQGDQLLQADRRLAIPLDGVYQRGEAYLRGMQHLSFLAFGTQTGRFLTRYVAVPFGGAYLALAFLDHAAERITGLDLPIKNTLSVLLSGVFLLGLIYLPAFRQTVWQSLVVAGRGLRLLLVELPLWIVRLPLVAWLRESRWFRWGVRWIVKPAVVTGLLWAVIPLYQVSWRLSEEGAGVMFLVVNLLLNSRLGRNVEEVLVDWIVQGWQRFGIRILTGLFWLVIDFFKAVLENTERLLYTVDEWLQFHSGETRFALVAKGALGVVWFFLTYVIRFCLNVLIEPQINPIKHFPVVSVSHKLLLPFIPTLASVLSLTLEKGLAYTIATTIIASIPGVFGFLVWELRENWRLYAANRDDRLGPVAIGSHGETMTRLMKPGFHSGTLPKRFAKLRRAERTARSKGVWTAARKHLLALQHVEVSIHRYAQREFAALCEESRLWRTAPPRVGEIRLASNRIRIAILGSDPGDDPLWVVFELKAGWQVAATANPAWTDRLSPPQRQVLQTALLGLYKSGGVELIRQQIEAEFPPQDFTYDVTAAGLAVWAREAPDVEVQYDLHQPAAIVGRVVQGSPYRLMPTFERDWILFSDVRVSWQYWIDAWEFNQAVRIYPNYTLLGETIMAEAKRRKGKG